MANEFKIKKGLIVTGASGGTVVDIQGSQGQLFSVTDDLSGSIFAVSDISGVPILDVNSSGLVTVDGPFTQAGGEDSNFSGDVNIKSVFDFDTATDLFSITNNQNTGGINLSGNNSRIYFGGNRAIEGAQGGTNLTFAEGYTSSYFQSNVNVTGDVALTGSSKYIYLRTGTNSGLWQEDDFSLRFGTNNIEALELDNVQNATFAAQAFSAATSSGDDSSTLTTKGYVDGLITGATIYRGAWDPSGGGYGSPDLSGVTQTSGYYYICSADGTAEPNGTGTEPDTWAVGDWVIYNDVSGTGQWQKIDNSSVLSGVGTGQTVALWEGAGSVTDSETLGNAPITVSGSDTTFAGNITFGDSHFIGDDADDNLLIQSSANENVIINSPDDDLLFRTAGTTRLQITNTLFSVAQNATFAGDLTVNGDVLLGGSAAAPKTITIQQIGVTTTDANAVMQDGNGVLKIRTLGTGAFGPTPVGAYLPLSAGSSYPLTGALNINNTLPTIKLTDTDTSAYGRIRSSNGSLTLEADEGNTQADSFIKFEIDTDEKMRITSVGKVGIGTTNPQDALDVDWDTEGVATDNSGIRVRAYRPHLNLIDRSGYTASNGHNFQIKADSAKLQFNATSADDETFDLTRMVIDKDGNVGIGTTSPAYKLQVYDTSSSQVRITNGLATPVDLQLFASSSSYAGIGTASNHRLAFRTNNTEKVTILASGNVGIGTTSPDTKLHVEGNVLIDAYSQGEDNGLFFREGFLTIDQPSITVWDMSNSGASPDGLSINSQDGIRFRENGGEVARFKDGSFGIGTTSPNETLGLHKSTRPYIQFTSDSTGATSGDGSFIGFANNSGFLEIRNKENQPIRLSTNDTERMRIDSSGNVGIGTTSPSSFGATYKVLDLYGTNAMYAINTVGGIFGQINAANTDALYIGTRSNHKIHLTTNNSNALTILTDGKVGIGTTSPSAKLEVLGVNNDAILTLSRGNASQYLTFRGYQMASNGNHMLVSADDTKQVWVGHQSTTAELVVDVGGNVGIGTTSPGVKMDLEVDSASNGDLLRLTNSNTGGGSKRSAMIYRLTDSVGTRKDAGYIRVQGTNNNITAGASMQFWTRKGDVNPTESMRINTNGNVGIGTTSPGYKLTVESDTAYGGMLIEGNNAPGLSIRDHSSTSESKIYVQSTASSSGNLRISADNNNTATTPSIEFRVGNSEKVRISDAGNVGIGTTSPDTLLDVSSANFGATAPTVRITNTLNVGDWSGVTSDLGRFEFFADDTSGNAPYTLGYIGIKNDYTTGTPTLPSGAMVFATTTYNASGGAVERMRIDSSGNVGIGTTSPGYLLDLSKTAVSVDTYSGINLQASNYGYTIEGGLTQNVGGELIFSSNNAGTRAPRVKFAANGNVGIGTTTPNAKLDIQGTQGQLFSVTDDLSGSIFAVADISGVPIFDVNSSGVSYFDGSLGIGTTPSSGTKLEVNGQTIINSTNVATGLAWFNNQTEIFSFEDNSGGGRLLLSDTTVKVAISANSDSYFNGGNVGIGTTSPDSKLDVTGGDITVNTSGVGFMNFKYGSVGSEAIMGSIQTTGIDLKINATSDLLLLPGSNVGIGITNPSAKLEVLGQDIEFYSGTGSQSLQLGRNANERLEMYVNDNMGKITAIQDADGNGTHDFILNRIFGGTGANNFMIQKDGSTQLLVDTNGNVGIGTTSPAYPLDVVGTANIDTIIAGNPGNLTIGLAGTKGTFLTGMMQTNYIMHCSGSASNLAFTNGNTNSNALTFSRGSISGTVASIGSISMTATSTSYNTTSDYRLKENEEKISNAIDRLKNLKPIRFNWILEPEEEKVDGFLAHEVAEVVPEAVTGEKDAIDYKGDDDLQMLENSKLVPLLTAALQQAIDKIEALEQRIQSIENK